MALSRRAFGEAVRNVGIAMLAGLAGVALGTKDAPVVTWAGNTPADEMTPRLQVARMIGQQEGDRRARQTISAELQHLNGVALSDAVDTSARTATATQAIVQPLADALATLATPDTQHALERLQHSLTSAQFSLQQQGIDIGDLDLLRQLAKTWEANLPQLVAPLPTYATVASPTTQDAHAYLAAVQQRAAGKTFS